MAAFQLRGVGECMYVRFRIQTQLDEVGELRGWRVSPDRSILVLRHDSCVLPPNSIPISKNFILSILDFSFGIGSNFSSNLARKFNDPIFLNFQKHNSR